MTAKTGVFTAQRPIVVWHQIKYAVWWISRSKSATIGIIIVGIAGVLAAIGPLINPFPYYQINRPLALLPPAWMAGGSWQHPLGTDDLGRDLLSRIIYSLRIAFMVGGVVTILTASVGVMLGLIAGYFGKWVDTIIMRLVDVQWSFPYLILAIAFMSLFGTSITNLILVLVISGWVSYARVVRSNVLSLKEQDFVKAAISVGAKPRQIILRHILPNSMAPILVLASFNLAGILLMEAALSFIGLGIQPPTPSLGGLISAGRDYLYTSWWIITFPGVALMLLVLGINQLGDGLRDLLDPRLRGLL